MNKTLIFLLGVLTAFSALIIQTILIIMFPGLIDFVSSDKIGYLMLIAIIIEEVLKFAFIWKIYNNFKKHSSVFTYAIILGSGFAVTEIIFNVLSNPHLTYGLLLSYLGLLLIHLLTAALYGLYFLQKKKSDFGKGIATLGMGLILHSLFNLGVFYEMNIALLDTILVIILIILIKGVSCQKIQNKLELN